MTMCARSILTVTALALGAFLAACTQQLETRRIARDGLDAASFRGVADDRSACGSAFGGYYLPRALIHITIGAENVKKKQVREAEISRAAMVADKSRMFCLDYLGSPTSQDALTIHRDENGLLMSIGSSVRDRTPEIAMALAETAKNIAISAARELTFDAKPEDTLDIVFDPFEPTEFRLANVALSRFGMCVSVDDPMLQCATRATYDPTGADELAVRDAMGQGILYRPLKPHRFALIHKGKMIAIRAATIEMPNMAPAMALRIDRALFTTRQTEVTFSQGVLSSIRMSKGSELEGAVKIPLAAAMAVVSVPTELVQVRINDANNRAALLDAQGKLLNALGDLQTAKSGRSLTGRAYSNCLDALGTGKECARALGGAMR